MNKPTVFTRPKRIGPEEKFLIAGLSVVAGLILAMVLFPSLGSALTSFSRSWESLAIRYGYIGAFVSSVVGNATVLIIFPYTAIIFVLAAFGLNPILLGVVTGLGSMVGELVSYIVARTGSNVFAKKRPASYEAVRSIVERRPRLIPTLLFIFAVLPLPDDLLLIPLGIVRYSIWRIVGPMLLGKTLAALVITYTGRQANALIFTNRSALSDVIINGLILGVIVVGIYLFFRIRWETVLKRFVPELPKDLTDQAER
jgi:membrane protein YqaA with SNARE-associated domain